ncbi:MAG TPA: SAM-dependent methyltransferase [Pyrinomonadaceae bacterium]|jgi:SAM-dependent MidA family methyltransferase
MASPEAVESIETPLAERLRERIRREGAITFRDWMEAALYDPHEGYYQRRDLTRWGRKGDYRTSPERSPLFAATCARYFASLYEELGSPHVWTLLEAGAGAGHFARGVLETFERFYPRVFAATRFLIDELSQDARQRAECQLARFKQHVEFRRLSDIKKPLNPGVIFSNELLDSFPIHRVLMRKGHLLELCVGLSDRGDFIWIEREPTIPSLLEHFALTGVNLSEGQIAEVNLAAKDWVTRAAAILERGYLITVDYGDEADNLYGEPHRSAGTLRAFRQHHLAYDALAHPGDQDITTTVNWTQIRKVGEASGLRHVSFERQDEFLLRAGLLDQLELMTNDTRNETESLILRASAREMILPAGLSTSFQVLVQKR